MRSVEPAVQQVVERVTRETSEPSIALPTRRTDPNELAEEMVRMLVRVRRHMPRRR